MTKPDLRPWLKRAEWRAGVISSRHGRWFEVPLLLLALVIMVMIANRSSDRSEPMMWFFFVLIAAIGAVGPLKRFVRLVRDKPATFEFEQVPFIVGEKLRGMIKARLPGKPVEFTRVILECRIPVADDPDEVVTQSRKQWIPDQLVWVGEELQVPVDLDIGVGPATGERKAYWRLTLSSDFPNLNYETYFDVPVYGRNAAPLVQETALGRAGKRDVRRAMRVFDDQ